MTITVYPFTEGFAAEIGDVDLAQPLSPGDEAAIKAAFWKYAVLVFPGQQLNSDQHVAFSERFGPMEPNINTYADEIKKDRIDSRVSDVSNLGEDNEILPAESRKRRSGLANRLWHTDSIFRHVPARVSLLHARTVAPVGGNTEFADMRAAYDTLDAATRALVEDLVCEHSLMYSRGSLGFVDYTEEERAMFRPVRQRLVRTHPVSGRRSLYLSAHAGAIIGMPIAEARILLKDLTEHATQPAFVYAHKWSTWDVVMWDNRQMMHRARRYDETQPRDMRRTTIAGDAPTVAQVAAA